MSFTNFPPSSPSHALGLYFRDTSSHDPTNTMLSHHDNTHLAPIQLPFMPHTHQSLLSPDSNELVRYSLTQHTPITTHTSNPTIANVTDPVQTVTEVVQKQGFKVPRPPNAFLLFRREKVATDASIRGLPLAEASKKVSLLWQSLALVERERYEKLAKEVKKEHARVFKVEKKEGKKRKSVQDALLPPIQRGGNNGEKVKKPSPIQVGLRRKRTDENEESNVSFGFGSKLQRKTTDENEKSAAGKCELKRKGTNENQTTSPKSVANGVLKRQDTNEKTSPLLGWSDGLKRKATNDSPVSSGGFLTRAKTNEITSPSQILAFITSSGGLLKRAKTSEVTSPSQLLDLVTGLKRTHTYDVENEKLMSPSEWLL